MAKAERYAELADKVVEYLGGKDNISFFTHCTTRLRFNVKDKSLVKNKEIEGVKGVMGCQWSGDQFQVIIGQAVGDAYNLIAEKAGLERQDAVDEDLDGTPKKKFSFNAFFDAISGCITPLIPIFMGAGFLKIIVLLLTQFNVLPADSGTSQMLSFVGDAGFYFMPIFIGGFTARKFGANMALGMLLGAAFVDPSFVQAVTDGTTLDVYGLPVMAVSYGSSVIPAILTVWVMSYVEKFFAKHSPDAVRAITEPLFTLLVMLPLAFCVLGPLGSYIGTYMSIFITWLYDKTGFIGVAVLSALYPLLVMTGMHSALTPYAINSLTTLGYEPLLCPASTVSNISQGAAAAAVALKSKDNEDVRSVASASAITAIVGGITEPAMFGVNFRFKTPLYASMIGNFAGAAVAGYGHAAQYAIGGQGLFVFPAYIGGESGVGSMLWLAAGMAVACVVTFAVTMVIYKPEASATEK